ncbi:hypothetical protein KQI84_14425 [bacterium]|nr:hypothetical protein [bacterium]
MSAGTRMILVRSHGPNTQSVGTALKIAVGYARDNNLEHILLLVPTKGNAATTIVGSTLGEDFIKGLLKQDCVVEGIRFSTESVKTFSKFTRADVAIGFHVAKDGIDKVVDSEQLRAFVFVPWLSDEGEAFEKTWQPSVFESDGAPAEGVSPLLLTPALEQELESLTRIVNLSTGIGHPSDKRTAQDKFKALKKQGVEIDPEAVRAWAVTHGWQSDDADDLAKLAARYAK